MAKPPQDGGSSDPQGGSTAPTGGGSTKHGTKHQTGGGKPVTVTDPTLTSGTTDAGLDFAVPADGKYVIKAHDLTFQGGPAYFYRLGVWQLPASEPIARLPSTRRQSRR